MIFTKKKNNLPFYFSPLIQAHGFNSMADLICPMDQSDSVWILRMGINGLARL